MPKHKNSARASTELTGKVRKGVQNGGHCIRKWVYYVHCVMLGAGPCYQASLKIASDADKSTDWTDLDFKKLKLGRSMTILGMTICSGLTSSNSVVTESSEIREANERLLRTPPSFFSLALNASSSDLFSTVSSNLNNVRAVSRALSNTGTRLYLHVGLVIN